MNDVVDLNSLLNHSFIDTINRFGNFYGHLDMAFTGDSIGLALGFTAGSKTMKDSEEDKEETEAEAPIYCLP
ncbi:hypothetical protein, partial [Halovibrio sp. HP20-50]|uniref:hypothetical protein n=1 Tax=Halovibrio sp. HP20-59 TaxID=3080275 RepID=UPI00294B800D